MHNNYPHQIKETFHTQRQREGGNSISIISSIRKELLFIKKGKKAQQKQGRRQGSFRAERPARAHTAAAPGTVRPRAGRPAACAKGSPGSVLPPHTSSSSPGSRNPFLQFLGELLPGGSFPPWHPLPASGRVGSQRPSSDACPPRPKAAAGGGERAGMRRLPRLCGTRAGPSGVEAARSRGRIRFVFRVQGRGIIHANY